ncbi:dihydrolipoyl dehydrogenase [Thiohalomonas denitrificans]|uniref:dihydrolipoyl dehydrogenase n=1 Tax=Thiohalomonas denitrificans TaxID=415747 RepID=UPI0026F09BC6|nr:dihydrolipoyl dehydrogenase [Thiohalomonas denitrificans]
MVMGELPVNTDLLVIGGGPGGYAAAFRAADLGLDVTMVTDEPLGGVCLLRGCIPSKTLLYLAELLEASRAAESMGLRFGEPEIDLKGMGGWRDKVIGQLVHGLEGLCRKRGVQLIRGRAHFESSERVRLEHSDIAAIDFRHAIIATGSRPRMPPGVEAGGPIMDSTGALKLPDIPERLLAIGGGYVGLEMGTVYAALGSRVTIVQSQDRLLPPVDDDLVKPLARKLEKRFEAIHYNTRATGLEIRGETVQVALAGDVESTERFDRVLVAIGRVPNIEGLNLEATGVERDRHGAIRTDEQRRTADANIFAIGDVVGGTLLAHKAMHEGKVAAEAIAGQPAAFDARAIPAVVYTDPQIAWCGLTEREAQSSETRVRVDRFPWKASGRALSMGAEEGMTKTISDPESGRLLGVGIVGRHAEALIAEATLAIEMGAVAEDLARSIHPHPTLSETLSEAAELTLGGSTHFK